MLAIHWLDVVPVAYVVALETEITDEELAHALADMTRSLRMLLAQQRQVVSIIDLTRARLLNAKQRAIVHGWVNESREVTVETSLGVAFVAPSTFVRGALTAIFWFQDLGAPHTIVANLADAASWTAERLGEARVPVAPDALSHIERALTAIATRFVKRLD